MESKSGEVGIKINNNLHMYKTRCIGDESYRYVLELGLKEKNNDKKIMFILKNPSKANCEVSDPTLDRLAEWTLYHQIHNFTVCNIYARRATKPEKLKAFSQNERIGEINDNKIKDCLKEHKEVILGWGTPNPLPEKDYNSRIVELLKFEEIKSKNLFKVGNCLKEEYPKHPLGMWSHKMEKLSFNIQKALDSLRDEL
ncbi:DUF1643 domain-containing protein [Candidatus Woesearchaeota archaeon]|nr:DUF1643 domain-containing protein [Candidatus Woesearchaeota archaeon]